MSNQPGALRFRRSPYAPVTIGLCVVFGLVYCVEILADAGALWTISAPTLVRVGGNMPIMTLGDGQYWRLVTAALLHGGLLHIAFNSYAMLLIGSAIERTLGAGWTVGCFVFSGITGSLLSGYANAPNVVAIGASGGIFGLVAMAAVLAFLAPRLTRFSREVLVQWLMFALAVGVVGGFDNWGHVGGIVGGALCALPAAFMKNNPKRVRSVGVMLGAVGMLLTVASVFKAAQQLWVGG